MKRSSLTENKAQMRSTQVIRAGFALVMLIIAFIVIFGLNRLAKVHESLAQIVDNEQVAIEMLFRMQRAARDRSIVLYRIASTQDPFERDEQMLRYTILGTQFGEARSKLSELKLNESEKTLLAQQWDDVLTTMAIQKKVIGLAAHGQLDAAQEVLNNQAIPAQDKILESINTLLGSEIMESHEYAQLIQKQQWQTRYLMVAGGVLAALFVGMIARFVNRRMGMLISGLSSTAQELHETNKHLAFMQQAVNQHNIVSIADVHGNITYANDLFCRISLYSKQALLGKNHRLLKSGMHADEFFEEMWSTISSGKIWQGEICNRNKLGGHYWVATTIVPMLNDSGLPSQYISVRTDITSIKEAQQILLRSKDQLEALVQERTAELQEREEVLNSITSAAQDAVIMIDHKGNVTYWNPAAEKIFGYAANEISGRNLHSMVVHPRYLDAHRAAFSHFIQTGTGPLIGAKTEIQALRRDGSEFPVELSISSVKLKNNWHAVATVRDITDRKLAEDQLTKFATTDTLTGAFNRRRFNEVISSELSRASRYHNPLSLLILDIDHFKHINDTFGHQAGDQVLIQLSLLVSANLRDTDVFARWGGEEFTILAPDCDDACALNLAEKLRIAIQNADFPDVGRLTCSFGVTSYRENDIQQTIIKRADDALYRAKAAGRNCVEFE